MTPGLPEDLNASIDVDVDLEQTDAQGADTTPAPPPQPLQVAAHIAGSQSIRERITAYVKQRRWQDPDADVRAPIPLDDLASAVAADQQISDWICQWLAAAPAETRTQAERACADLPDADIIRVVDIALERLGTS